VKRAGTTRIVAVVVAAGALLTACSSSGKSAAPATTRASATSANATKVAVALTADGCGPAPARVNPGTFEFDITNNDAASVTEVELTSGDGSQLLDTKDGVTPGHTADFTRKLTAGDYKLHCPGANQTTWDFVVNGENPADAWKSNAQLVAAVNGYSVWIKQEVGKFATNTRAFVAAIKAGNVDEAKELYAQARLGYESVEPVAEAFGDLDRDIDGRINDFVKPSQFEGFHRLEEALFVDNSVAGMNPIADGLVGNVNKLERLVATQQYAPIELASGATDLINEIEESKITGEEERYSNIDLVDFQGNLAGAMEVVKEFTPYLQVHDPALLAQINTRYAATQTALDKYKADPGYVNTGYVNYKTVTDPERRDLSVIINSLAESISSVVVVVSK
jgi:iron uptake system component EfeO